MSLPKTPLIFVEGGRDARETYDAEQLEELGAAGHLERVGDRRISWDQRQRMRGIVKAVHLRHVPGEFLTDAECDKHIESWSAGYFAKMQEKLR